MINPSPQQNDALVVSFAGCRAFDDRDRGRAHTKQILIGIFDFDANRESLRDAHPV
jgi:hypothetical protein